MKRLLIVFVLVVLPVANSNSQVGFNYMFGGNYSKFRRARNELEIGFSLGIGHEWKVFNNMNISSELHYSFLRADLIGVVITSGWDVDSGHLYNLNCSIGSLEIPLLVKYYYQLAKDIKLHILLGPSLSIGLLDSSEKDQVADEPIHIANMQYDYIHAEDPGELYILDSSGFRLNVGVGLVWSAFSFECRYSRAMFDIETLNMVRLNDELNGYHFMLGVSLDKILNSLN